MTPMDAWRLGIFILVLTALVVWEQCSPERAPTQSAWRRWRANLGLYALGAIGLRIIAPLGLVGVAVWAQALPITLLQGLHAPAWAAFLITLVALDGALYAQHRAMHAVPWLWRLHAPHHADPDLDVSSGLRFHPLEFLASFALKAVVITLLGAPPLAVVVFEIVLNAFSLFSHANGRMPSWLERPLAHVIVTPRVHRLHHDRDVGARSGNYGFSILVWDILFGTRVTREQPTAFGITGVAPSVGGSLRASLALPAATPVTDRVS